MYASCPMVFFYAFFCLLIQQSLAFQNQAPQYGRLSRPSFLSNLAESSPLRSETPLNTVIQDSQGKDIIVNSVVRVSKSGLKAYQLPSKGQGHFNEQKVFVLDESNKKPKYLAIPIGLRGTVTKVYDVDDVSANFPIQVKFEPGKNTDEGYDPPMAFIMHFMSEEVECV